MKVTVLGVGNEFTPDITSTSFLITFVSNNKPRHFLVNCGWGVFKYLLANDIIPSLHGIFITTTREDCIGNLSSLLLYMQINNMQMPLLVGPDYTYTYLELNKNLWYSKMYLSSPYQHLGVIDCRILKFKCRYGSTNGYGYLWQDEECKQSCIITGMSDQLNSICTRIPANYDWIIFHDYAVNSSIYTSDNEIAKTYSPTILKHLVGVHYGKCVSNVIDSVPELFEWGHSIVGPTTL